MPAARQVLRAAGFVKEDPADVILIDFAAADFMPQSVKDVAVELCDAVGGQHVHVLEHVPEGSNICSMAPKEYPLRLGWQRSVPACKVLRGEVVIPAHSFWGRFSSSVPCHVVLKQDAPCDAESGGCTQRLHTGKAMTSKASQSTAKRVMFLGKLISVGSFCDA